MTTFEILKQALLDKQKSTNKFDYEKRQFKIKNGSSRVRILPPLSGDLPFIEDYLIKLNDKTYIDSPSYDSDVIKKVKKIWSDSSSVRQNVYRSIKPQKRFQFQVLNVESDGTIIDDLPKLMTLSKTAFDKLSKLFLEGTSDPYESDIIVTRSGSGLETHYEFEYAKQHTPTSSASLDSRVELTANRYYGNDAWMPIIKNIYRDLNMIWED